MAASMKVKKITIKTAESFESASQIMLKTYTVKHLRMLTGKKHPQIKTQRLRKK